MKIKSHILTQGNIKGDQLRKALDQHFPSGVDVLYTDPPWGQGTIKYWNTLNKKNTGDDTEILSVEQIETIIVDYIMEYVKQYGFIIYGKREAAGMMARLTKTGLRDIELIPRTYNSGSKRLPNVVITFRTPLAPAIDWRSLLEGTNDMDTLRIVCDQLAGKAKTVLDMFIGIGDYLKMLDRYGFTVVGNELNSARLEKAIAKIS